VNRVGKSHTDLLSVLAKVPPLVGVPYRRYGGGKSLRGCRSEQRLLTPKYANWLGIEAETPLHETLSRQSGVDNLSSCEREI
jgi:hypothetical protein